MSKAKYYLPILSSSAYMASLKSKHGSLCEPISTLVLTAWDATITRVFPYL